MTTGKYVRFGAFVLAVSMALALFAAQESSAIPASPFPFTVTQPDGTTAELYRRGDEFLNWVETPEGYAVLENEATGYWEFAASSGGRLVSTGMAYAPGKTPPAGLEKHQGPEIKSTFHEAASTANKVWTPRVEPLAGERKILLIRVDFADQEFSDVSSEDLHRDQLFGETNSVKKYYHDQSRGKLELVPALDLEVISVTLSRDHPDRLLSGGGDNESAEKAHREEVKFVTQTLKAALEKAGKNLSDFANKDGYVTPNEVCVYFILAGYEESAGLNNRPAVWAHAWGSIEEEGPLHTVEVDGVVLTDWAMHGELIYDGLPMQIGVMAHELGHQLCRLPDLYDVEGVNDGLGAFSLMAGGSWGTNNAGIPGSLPVNFDAWTRQYLGWEKPRQPADGPVAFSTPGLGEGTGSVKLLRGGHRTTEYFLAEIRDFSGWDEGLEGLLLREFDEEDILELWENFKGGLLILHVDETIGSGSLDEGNDINAGKGNTHQGVMAVDASDPQERDLPSSPYTLWWGKNEKIGGGTGETVDFKTPDSNFYDNTGKLTVITDISITGIGDVDRGKLTAAVTTPKTHGSGGGCDAGAASGIAAFALIVCGMCLAIRRRA